MTDIEIARSAKLKDIREIAKKINLQEDDLELYGKYKAKITKKIDNKKGKLILVTAINPTSAGEGKTTVSIGLADAFTELNKKVCLALREPSLGPVFGIKGGATGGGYSQVAPMEDINLHFTGDFHAITSANNLLASLIDNHIYQGNVLNIDPNNIVFNRCLDLNDRALRRIKVACGEKDGIERDDRFNITSASEVMAIICLSKDIDDLKKRLGNILVAYTFDNKPIFARDLKAENAMTILLKDALKPNLVQTLIGTPAIIHGGPFANIAHGCNTIIATKTAMSSADYTITEAGFGAELGAQKFLDTKCRIAGLSPNAVVIVATARALKLHGGMDKTNLNTEGLDYIEKGILNLKKHVENMVNIYHLPVVVAINKFYSDTDNEITLIKNTVESWNLGVQAIPVNVWGEGGKGAIDLANKVISLCDEDNSQFTFSYKLNDSVENKIKDISQKIYGAKDIVFTEKARNDLQRIKDLGLEDLPIIIAKTQYSLSDNAKLLGAPTDFDIKIRELQIRSGAGFIVAVAGTMLLMPGLSKEPAAINMTIDSNNIISGLF